MAEIQLEIEGQAAVAATEELLQFSEVSGHWEPASLESEREGILATIATIVGIAVGSLTLAEKIYSWYNARRDRSSPDLAIGKVVLIGRKGRRILLEGASVEDIQRLLDE